VKDEDFIGGGSRGMTIPGLLHLDSKSPEYKKLSISWWKGIEDAISLNVDVDNRFHQSATAIKLAGQPKLAPILHFNGPLSVSLFTSQAEIVRTKEQQDAVFVTLGTKSPTSDIVYVNPPESILGSDINSPFSVSLKVELTSADEGTTNEFSTPYSIKYSDDSRGFLIPFEIPKGMDGGKATFKVTFDFGDEFSVPPYQVTLPIIDQTISKGK